MCISKRKRGETEFILFKFLQISLTRRHLKKEILFSCQRSLKKLKENKFSFSTFSLWNVHRKTKYTVEIVFNYLILLNTNYYYLNSLFIFIFFLVLLSRILLSLFYNTFFLLDKYRETNIQRYKCTKNSLISFQNIFKRYFLKTCWATHSPFCTYRQDR